MLLQRKALGWEHRFSIQPDRGLTAGPLPACLPACLLSLAAGGLFALPLAQRAQCGSLSTQRLFRAHTVILTATTLIG
jgi:hypothetical protein